MPETLIFNSARHHSLLPSFVDLHIACVEHDHTIATFLPPFTPEKREKMLKWWQGKAEDAEGGNSHIFMDFLADNSGRDQLAGYVVLLKPQSDTGPFRGPVEKLLVSPNFRRRGVAKRLMDKLEEVARKEGRTLLLLDTEKGSPAELVYPKLGWIECGFIPAYEISPLDGSLHGETFFYKNLR